jgi:hypothetical protein
MFKEFFNIFRDVKFSNRAPIKKNVRKCVIKITDINNKVYERQVHGRLLSFEDGTRIEDAVTKSKEIIFTYMSKGLMETDLNNFIPRELVRNIEICEVTDHLEETYL